MKCCDFYISGWINTVQVLILCLTLLCYGFGPVGVGMEKKNGQVLVTSLSLQQVQHQEPRNIWIGPRGDDLVHLGAKFAACKLNKDVTFYKFIIVALNFTQMDSWNKCNVSYSFCSVNSKMNLFNICFSGMRRDFKILDVMAKTRRQERETACCIRNDDSGCVQSSQADCSVRGLWPTVC